MPYIQRLWLSHTEAVFIYIHFECIFVSFHNNKKKRRKKNNRKFYVIKEEIQAAHEIKRIEEKNTFQRTATETRVIRFE